MVANFEVRVTDRFLLVGGRVWTVTGVNVNYALPHETEVWVESEGECVVHRWWRLQELIVRRAG